MAGIVSPCSDFHFNRYGHPIGFLNILLYAPGYWIDGFKDVRVGFNPGCGTDGWDPVRPASLVSVFRVIFDVG